MNRAVGRLFALGLALALGAQPLWLRSAQAAPQVRRVRPRETPQPPSPPSAAPSSPDNAPAPYDPELLRLSQIMGALSFLRDLCGDGDGELWRSKMSALLQAVGDAPLRRERMAGAFNQGFRDYELMYRTCTPNARRVISNYLQTGGRLTRDVESRFGGG